MPRASDQSSTSGDRSSEAPASGFFFRRAPRYLALFALAFAAGNAFARGGGASDVRELAARLGEASERHVRAEDVRWEPSRGVVEDFVLGRFVLFLASEAEGGPRDVLRARVRVSPEGSVIGVSSGYNLTATPLGDDHDLVVLGSRAAFATQAYGQEQSLTVLDLSGEGAQNQTTKLHDRAMAFVTNVQQTGSGEGIGRLDVTLDQPARRVGLAMRDRAGDVSLDVALADDDRGTPSRVARVDLGTNELVAPSANDVHVEPARHLAKPLVFWAVDTVRAVPWIGPRPIAWLEEQSFAIRDELKQTAFKLTAGGDVATGEIEAPPSVLDASGVGDDGALWPPPPLHSIWPKPEPGEGEWAPPKQAWLKKFEPPPGCEAGAADAKANGCEVPPPFYVTFVRPDKERPYAKVFLVAMDMRQLELGMEAGSEDPKPLTGPPGTGRIPRDPKVYKRVAAAFNGGFKTEHGNYGMMLNKRVLLPPVPGAATVILTKDARVGMGSWGTNKDVGGIANVPTDDIVSFRQNLDPLIDGETVNPSGRSLWGFTLPGTSMQTERSGICVNAAGHLMYAWGDDVSGTVLGNAMKLAGCIYGMHLDMNPHHTGFLFTNVTELKGRNYKTELLTTEMEIDTSRYVEYAPKDFFYVMLRDPTPPPIEGASAWAPDPGTQPAPSYMPALWTSTSTTASGDVSLLTLEPGRASFRVRAGSKEPDSKAGTTTTRELVESDARRVLFALSLGVASPKHALGLATDGKIALPIDAEGRTAALVASEDGALDIVDPRTVAIVPPHTDVAELPLAIADGRAASEPASTPALSALGITERGAVFVARSVRGASAKDVVTTLLHAGCTKAVWLDRGDGLRGVMHRAGTETPPRSRYEDTTLYALGKPLLPRGFRFDAEHPVPPPAPKKK